VVDPQNAGTVYIATDVSADCAEFIHHLGGEMRRNSCGHSVANVDGAGILRINHHY